MLAGGVMWSSLASGLCESLSRCSEAEHWVGSEQSWCVAAGCLALHSTQNPVANGKAKISKTQLQGIPSGQTGHPNM